MKYYVFRLITPRSTFMSDMTSDERALMFAHATYWKELTTKGQVVIFGPVLDPAGPYGLGIVRLAEADDPNILWKEDPVIKAQKGFTYEVAPMASAVVSQ
jgi:uncharacterized protein YciI